MEQKKKVLFFTPSKVGGAERVTLTIAKMLPQDEYDVKIVFVCRAVEELKDFVPAKIPTEHVYTYNIWDFATWKLFWLIKKEKPYAVFTSFNYLWGRMLLAAHFANPNIKTIVRSNIGYNRWFKKSIRCYTKYTIKWADYIIMQTEEMQKEFETVFPSYAAKMHTIANPIDKDTIAAMLKIDDNNPFDSSKINFVSTCRIVPEKCIDDLLMAFSIVVKQIPKAHLTILGTTDASPEYSNKLSAIIQKEKLSDSVSFVGLQRNLYKYIKYADCFVLPSRIEGYPNTLLEAMYLRTPVVSTRSVPVIERVLTPDRGFVVNVGDIEDMANSMTKALNIKHIPPYIQDNEQKFRELFY